MKPVAAVATDWCSDVSVNDTAANLLCLNKVLRRIFLP
jgi:hypothetical protein